MRLLDRYLVWAMAGPTALALVFVGFLIVANELKEQSHRLIVHVLTAWDIVVLGVAFLPSLLPLILPVALFVGVLTAYGRLAERHEITAMRAAGVSLARLVAPAAALGLAMTIGAMLLQDKLQPRTMSYALNFFRFELPRRASLDTLEAGVMHPIGNWRVYFRDRDADTHMLHDVTVVRHEEGEGATVYRGAWARLVQHDSATTLVLNDGHLVSPEDMRGSFETLELPLPTRFDGSANSRSRIEQNFVELLASEREAARVYADAPSFSNEKDLRDTRHEIADRASKPFAAFLFSVIGALLASESARYRRGGRQRLFAVSALPIFMYYLLHLLLDPNSLWPLRIAVLLAWVPNFVLLALAGALYIRSARVH